MRIGLDVMGGDNAPSAILEGAFAARKLLEDGEGAGHKLRLIGDAELIEQALAEAGLSDHPLYEVEPTQSVIGMAESPVRAIREKSDSSLVRMGELGRAEAGAARCDAIISAGNTGACVATAQMYMRRLPNVVRPGIAVVIPTPHGPVVICDVGANPEPKPAHLHQYAHMAAAYAEGVLGVSRARVGVMNIGGEEGKGTPLIRETQRLCQSDPTLADAYVGSVEGRDLFEDAANVVLTEGFTGNVVLKLAEGLASGIFKIIFHEIEKAGPDAVAQFKPILGRVWQKHDYHEFGGAPLLGVNGICMIAHGSSEARTIHNAIRSAIDYARHDVNGAIVQRLATLEDAVADASAEGEAPSAEPVGTGSPA